MDERSELEKLLGDIPQDTQTLDDILGSNIPEKGTQIPEKDEELEEVPDSVKNRRHRRLEQQLQREREEKIRLQAQLEARTELQSFQKDADVDPRFLQMYGDDENGRRAAKLHQEALADAMRRAEESAYTRYQREQADQKAEESKQIEFLDQVAEGLEDDYGIDLTSNAPAARKANREYFTLLEKMSPKDDRGNVIEYADFNAVMEIFQAQRTKPDNSRQKDLADKTMTKSAPVSLEKEEVDANAEWLRRNGII